MMSQSNVVGGNSRNSNEAANEAKYVITAKPPRYFAELEEFVAAHPSIHVTQKPKIRFTFDRIKETWPAFRERYNRPRVRKTKEEKSEARTQRMAKQMQKADFWRSLRDANVDALLPQFRHAVLAQEKAIQQSNGEPMTPTTSEALVEQVHRRSAVANYDTPVGRDRLTDRMNRSANNAETPNEENNNALDSMSDSRDDDVFRSPIIDNDDEDDDEPEDNNANKNYDDATTDDDDDQVQSEDFSRLSFSLGGDNMPNKKRKLSSSTLSRSSISVDPEKEECLKQSMRKVVPDQNLRTLRAKVETTLHNLDLAADGEIQQLFDELFAQFSDVNGALNQVATIMKPIIHA